MHDTCDMPFHIFFFFSFQNTYEKCLLTDIDRANTMYADSHVTVIFAWKWCTLTVTQTLSFHVDVTVSVRHSPHKYDSYMAVCLVRYGTQLTDLLLMMTRHFLTCMHINYSEIPSLCWEKFIAKTPQVLSLFYMYFVASLKSSFPTNRWMFVNCSGAC